MAIRHERTVHGSRNFVVLILLGVWMVQNNRNEQEKKLVQLRKKWGKKAGETDGTGKEKKNWKRV